MILTLDTVFIREVIALSDDVALKLDRKIFPVLFHECFVDCGEVYNILCYIIIIYPNAKHSVCINTVARDILRALI